MLRKFSTREIQEAELGILLEVKKLCDANDLKIYLVGGTLLGAIRHKGFIPWDDDIDVAMTRPDYDKLVKLLNRDGMIPNYLEARGCVLGNGEIPFIKVVDKRLRVNQKYQQGKSAEHLWIDIFPVDGLPQNNKEVRKIYNTISFYRKILCLNWAREDSGTTKAKKVIKRFLIPLAKLIGIQRCNMQIEKLAHKYDYAESEYVGIITWGLYGVREKMKKNVFEKSIEVEFEKHMFSAMSCWETYLSNLYGEYMQLPPVDRRQTHNMEVYMEDLSIIPDYRRNNCGQQEGVK